ncbi:MAG: YdcF family protein [Sphingomonadaceae bacterium]
MITRAAVLAIISWILGFFVFAGFLPRPADGRKTDAIVVPTGGEGRIARGIDLLGRKRASRMLVSGVDPRVTKAALAELQHLPLALVECCVDLGRAAVDTRSNALETAQWVRQNRYRSVRLVTTDWHMRRAHLELSRSLSDEVAIVPDAVRSEASLSVLLREYNKFLYRWVVVTVGL